VTLPRTKFCTADIVLTLFVKGRQSLVKSFVPLLNNRRRKDSPQITGGKARDQQNNLLVAALLLFTGFTFEAK